jgi:hypothetical protein
LLDLTVVDWIEKVPAIITDVICPDGQSKCQTGQTCCKMATGDYGCCPIPKDRVKLNRDIHFTCILRLLNNTCVKHNFKRVHVSNLF